MSVVLLYGNMYVPFTPKLFDGAKDVYKVVAVDNHFYLNLDKVLKFYQIQHQFRDNKIYIKRFKAMNNDLLWNYTEKALDRNWIKDH